MRYKDQLPALGCETVRKGLLNGKPSENRWCVHLGAFHVPGWYGYGHRTHRPICSRSASDVNGLTR